MIGDCRFDDDSKSGWNEIAWLYNAQSFVGNRNNFPVDVLFSVLVMAAPVLVTFSRSGDSPVGNLALSGAVSSLLTATTKFGRGITNLKTKSAVPYAGRTDILFRINKIAR